MKKLMPAIVVAAAFSAAKRSDVVQQAVEQMCSPICLQDPYFEKMPPLSRIDREALATCPDDEEDSVSADAMYAYFARHGADPRVVAALERAGEDLEPTSFPINGRLQRFSREQVIALALVRKWASEGTRNGFTHVFCGDGWDGEQIGGLHYLPRYAALEAEGDLCFRGVAKGRLAKAPHVTALRYEGTWPWSCAKKTVGSFPENSDAIDILAAGIDGYAQCCQSGSLGGVFTDRVRPGLRWRIHCNVRHGPGHIDSLYPTTESPTCDPRPRWDAYDAWKYRDW